MQTKRPPARRSIWESGVWNPLGSLSVGVGILGACLCLMVGLFCIANAADWMISCMAAAALIASGYGMGFFAAFHRRHSGLKTGLLCGALLYLVLLLGGVIWRGDASGVLRQLLLLTSSAWGGVCGVNHKHRKPPR
ncbi:MAG: TIGR04086 family membrane protein [Ruminococcus sp.]|nr:TIGR04086 family membrane protein [Ruminococcus sp.]